MSFEASSEQMLIMRSRVFLGMGWSAARRQVDAALMKMVASFLGTDLVDLLSGRAAQNDSPGLAHVSLAIPWQAVTTSVMQYFLVFLFNKLHF